MNQRYEDDNRTTRIRKRQQGWGQGPWWNRGRDAEQWGPNEKEEEQTMMTGSRGQGPEENWGDNNGADEDKGKGQQSKRATMTKGRLCPGWPKHPTTPLLMVWIAGSQWQTGTTTTMRMMAPAPMSATVSSIFFKVWLGPVFDI
jgi:hypothetical protein